MLTVSKSKNCLSCSLYLRCKDPLKSVMYRCEKYSKDSREGNPLALVDSSVDLSNIKSLEASFSDKRIAILQSPDEIKDLDKFDIASLISESIKAAHLVAPDLKIPDGDFKQAPNFYTFCSSKDFLKIKPYLPQALIGTQLHAEYCPRCSEVEYFESYNIHDSLDTFTKKIALLEHGKCPHCKWSKNKLIRKKKLLPYIELAVAAGQRSGKTALVGMLASYQTHRVIKLQNPHEVYGGLDSGTIFHGTFVALTYGQARETLWEPYYNHIATSPWFQAYHSMLDEVGGRRGIELVKMSDTIIRYNHRRILCYPASPDLRILRGKTRIFAAIDELAYFDNDAESKKVKTNAREVYIALERSLLTVRAAAETLLEQGFANVPTGYFYNVSSPFSPRDKIMELVKQSENSPSMLGLQRPTWRMNPKVQKKHLKKEFDRDPIAAMRDYGAQPSISNNPFFTKPSMMDCFGKKSNCVSLQHKTVRMKDQSLQRFAEIVKVRRSHKASVMTVDAGLSNNSFALCLAHLQESGFPQIDAVLEVQPLPGVKLNYTRIYKNLMEPLIEARNVVLVGADQWNSEKFLSDIREEHDIEAVKYSLKYTDMNLFKDYMQSKEVVLPLHSKTLDEIAKYDHSQYPKCFRDDPLGHFYLQLMTVQDTGSSVVKGDQLTDDMVRAAMLAVKLLLDEKYSELWIDTAIEGPNMSLQSMVVYKGLSGGSSSGSRGSSGMGSSGRYGVRKSKPY